MRILMSVVAIASLAGALQAADWAGAYGRVLVGQRNSDVGIGSERGRYRLFGGSDIDNGRVVLGGEVELAYFESVQPGRGTGTPDSHVKLLADHGSTLLGGKSGAETTSFTVRVSFRF